MRMNSIRRERFRRCLAMALSVCLVFQSGVSAAYAATEGYAGIWSEDGQEGLALPDGRCFHHMEHDEACGYQECNHVHTDACYETRNYVIDEEELATPSDAELASPSDATPSDAEPATPSDAKKASSSDADEATFSDAEEPDPEEKEFDLINDLGEERVLVCRHKHDQDCGGKNCTFVCPYGCRYQGILPLEDPVVTLKDGAALIAGYEYSEDELMELVDSVEVTNAISQDVDERHLAGVETVALTEEDVVWAAETEGFSFFGLRLGGNEKNDTGFVPEEGVDAYTITYKLMESEDGGKRTAAVRVPVEEEIFSIITGLNKLVIGKTQDLLEGVKASPETTRGGEPVLVRVADVARTKVDGTEDQDFEWSPTPEGGEEKALLTPEVVGCSYTITYEAYTASAPETVLVESKVTVMVAGIETVGDMLVGDQALVTNVGMLADESTESKEAIRTGTDPFDNSTDASNYDSEGKRKPGIDFGSKDSVVRSFDVVTYTVHMSTSMQPEVKNLPGFREGRLYFEFILPVEKKYATFSTTGMGWLETKKEAAYVIEDRKVPNAAGEMVDGQVLRGSFIMTPGEDGQVAVGGSYRELQVAIQILGMQNGMHLKPRYTFWLEGNDVGTEVDENHVPTGSLVTDSDHLCSEHGKREYSTIETADIQVTAAPWYNIQIKNASEANTQAPGVYNFKTGIASAPHKSEEDCSVEGKLGCYGVTLQMVGKSKTQGLRGVEVPDGSPITFDLRLSSEFKPNGGTAGDVTADYTPLFWSIQGNRSNRMKDDGRYIPEYARSPTACVAAPYNEGTNRSSCKNGGTWSYRVDENDPALLHVTVSGYEVDLTRLPEADCSVSPTGWTYYNAAQIGEEYWNIQYACFSAGEVWMVQPYVDKDGVRITAKYPEGSDEKSGAGTFSTTLTGSNLKMTSISGLALAEVPDNSNQMILTDDARVQSIYVDRPGDIEQDIAFMKYNMGWPNYLTDGCGNDGRDWTTVGMGASLWANLTYDLPEEKNVGVAYDMLIKFDDACFVPDGTVTLGGPSSGPILWGAKKNGAGWDHQNLSPDQEGYDTEMKKAVVDDLVFYKSLDALKADDKTCVAVLTEFRGVTNLGRTQVSMNVRCKINPKVETNQVYMISQTARAWSKADVDRKVAADGGSTAGWEDKDYNSYVKNTATFPSRADQSVVSYKNYPQAFWVKEWTTQEELATYKKAEYDENGLKSGGSGGTKFGDSCLVLGFNSAIEKRIAQKSNAGAEKKQYDMDETQRVIDYVLHPSTARDGGEESTQGATFTDTFYIEDTLPDALTYIKGSSFWDAGGDGCGYTENDDSNEPGHVYGLQFEEKYVDEFSKPETDLNGKPVRRLEILEKDGETTLRWIMENITFDANEPHNLGDIHFSCRIGTQDDETTDVKNLDEISNTAKIWSNTDTREIKAENGNTSTVGIHITKNRAINISKIADDPIIELGEDMGFMMNVGNNGENIMHDTLVVETLPYNGADSGSSFHGDLIIKALRVGSRKTQDYDKMMESFDFYYTTNEEYQGITSKELSEKMAGGETFETSQDWHKLTITEEPEGDLPAGLVTDLPDEASQKAEPLTAIIAYGDLPAMRTLSMHIRLQIDGAEPGDYIVNRLSRDENESRSRSSIVSRMVEGMTWLDGDKNGLRTSGEAHMEGVTVTLLQLKDGGDAETEADYEPYVFQTKDGSRTTAQIPTGKQMNVMTGEIDAYTTEPLAEGGAVTDIGGYRFYNLPEGTFAVKFSDGSVETDGKPEILDLGEYKASPVDTGSNDEIDSDGVPTYLDGSRNKTEDAANGTLESTLITNIIMPPKDQINSRVYRSPFHDSGFYGPRATLRLAKWIDNWNEYKKAPAENDLIRDEFIVTASEQAADGNGLNTGVVLNHAGTDRSPGTFDVDKASGYIEIYGSSSGTIYSIDEIIPKEYAKSAEFLTYAAGYGPEYGGSISGSRVTVMPREEVIVMVHNTFSHDDYFHNDASAQNHFPGQGGPSGQQTNPAANTDLAAVVPERDAYKERLTDEDERLV